MRINRQNQYLAYVQPESSTVITDIGTLPKGLAAATVYNVLADMEAMIEKPQSTNTTEVGYLANLLYIFTLNIKGDRVRKIADIIKEWAVRDTEIAKVVISRQALGMSMEEFDKLLNNLQQDDVTNNVRLYAYE